MYNCFDIAYFFLMIARSEGKAIDTMKLLKLTYIAHGWYLGVFNKPLFINQVQARKYGPVIPELYHVIKRFQTGNVNLDIINLYSESELIETDKRFLNVIWNNYRDLNGLQLSPLR